MSKPAKIQAEKLIGTKFTPPPTTITDKDAIIYALGIGFSRGTFLQMQIHFEKKIISIPTSFIPNSQFSPPWEL